jgi:DNA polymerase-3 subunit delta
MVAISHANAERYLRRPNHEHFIFLFYGADQGLVVERAQTIVGRQAERPERLQIVELHGDAIASDPLLLVDEVNSIDLFGESNRAVRISVGSKSVVPALDLIIAAPPANCPIVLEAGDLKRDSALRRWIESQPVAAAIECRIDDQKDLERLIDTELLNSALSIEPDARELLCSMLGEDRLSTRSELNKLLLYTFGQPTVTIEHVRDILHDASALSSDDAVYAAFSSDRSQTAKLTDRALDAGVDPNVLLGTALRYSLALHRARIEIDRGKAFDETLQTVLRQIGGFGRKSEIAADLKRFKQTSLETIISALAVAIKATRSSNILTSQRVSRLFLSLSQAGNRN